MFFLWIHKSGHNPEPFRELPRVSLQKTGNQTKTVFRPTKILVLKLIPPYTGCPNLRIQTQKIHFFNRWLREKVNPRGAFLFSPGSIFFGKTSLFLRHCGVNAANAVNLQAKRRYWLYTDKQNAVNIFIPTRNAVNAVSFPVERR